MRLFMIDKTTFDSINSQIQNSEIIMKPTDELAPFARNSRVHSDHQVNQIAKSIKKFGFTNPVLIAPDDTIIAGHGRIMAALKLDLIQVPCVVLHHLSADELKAYVIADNQLALTATWDMDILGSELVELQALDFDLSTLGFDNLDDLLPELPKEDGLTDEDAMPEVSENELNVQRGEIYKLGEHRLMCGDSTEKVDVDRLMDGHKADMVHTDPPYNVDYSNQDRPKAGKIDLGRIKNDKMENDVFLKFLTDALTCSFGFCSENSSIYIWYASRETLNFHTAAAAAGWNINQQIIWKKPMLLGRGKYQWAHEPCVFGVKGSPYFTKDRTKTTIWDFGGYDKSKNIHPTQKPVFIPEEAINNSSEKNDIILDLFLGSGSTLIACEKTNRTCYGMELDPHYCSVIIKRWEDYTGKKAERVAG